MKPNFAIIKQTSLFLVIAALLTLFGYSLAHAADIADGDNRPFNSSRSNDETQLGFYDLLSETQEIYNLQIKNTGTHSYTVSISMDEDSRFVLKGKIEIVHDDNSQSSHLDFTPVYYHNPQPNRMINSIVDYSTNNDFLIRDLQTAHSQLVVASSGILILMPEVLISQRATN